jgi:5-oxoprolinase (ATP-hydrolysing)
VTVVDPWKFWIDRGGTFTDCIGYDPQEQKIYVEKVLSSDKAPVQGIRNILGLRESQEIPVVDVRMGTTVATNALLERRGAKCCVVITEGFGDVLEIGTQARPSLFDIRIDKPLPLHSRVIETKARASSQGRILGRVDENQILPLLNEAVQDGCQSVAIIVLNGVFAPELENSLGELAERAGFNYVALSHQVSGELGFLSRASTTLLDAYLTPLLLAYLAEMQQDLPGSRIQMMQSSGGLIDAKHFKGPAAVLSGPAGGIVACAEVAHRSGYDHVIGFDMGGTSTDVCRISKGQYERTYEAEIAGTRIVTPMLDIHTIASGGGSICSYDGYRFHVGPKSAGAIPGPLCYGHKDAVSLTITDINLALGHLVADLFPFQLDVHRVNKALDAILMRMQEKDGDNCSFHSREDVAEGFLSIANSQMAEAISQVSLMRGYDVREHALVVFGGAGAQHATRLARQLGIKTVIVHPLGGVLSAYGMGLADVQVHRESDAGRVQISANMFPKLRETLSRLAANAQEALLGSGFSKEQIVVSHRLDVRYAGTESPLTLELEEGDAPSDLISRFESLHHQRFGYTRAGHPIEIATARVEARGLHVDIPFHRDDYSGELRVVRTTEFISDGERHREVPVYLRREWGRGKKVKGPLVVLDETSVVLVESGFCAHMADEGVLILQDEMALPEQTQEATAMSHIEKPRDPVSLQLFHGAFTSIAKQMGNVLANTAISVNIRERLDFSCAVFDGQGGLVANAPHIPVHLGAMGESVRAVLEHHPAPKPGDMFVTNDPTTGGSHLPDMTVVTPVHDTHGTLLFFVANRGHHADIGGITPGSMPPFSSSLAEEGVVFTCAYLMREHVFLEEEIAAALQSGPYPSRQVNENLADLRAQVAANQKGAAQLLELTLQQGVGRVRSYMAHVQAHAAEEVSAAIRSIPDGVHSFGDKLDDGSVIQVKILIRGSKMTIDFSGSSAQHAGNLNAPRAVTMAAVLYVLRVLVGREIPLSSGCLQPIEVIIEEGSILAPCSGAAVAGGNVETSQRIVDVLLGALNQCAASQGTMNNLTMGNDQFGYYETIAGGAGAGLGYAGAFGVQTHMTNTRITDPETIENRYPIRLLSFSRVRGTGGEGKWRGGDGLLRVFQAQENMEVSILSQRRVTRPFGLSGGRAGAPGVNRLNGATMPGQTSFQVKKGDVFSVQTPGGGGFGSQ